MLTPVAQNMNNCRIFCKNINIVKARNTIYMDDIARGISIIPADALEANAARAKAGMILIQADPARQGLIHLPVQK